MPDDKQNQPKDQGAQPPGNGQDSGPLPQQEAAIKALTEILEALKRQTQATSAQVLDGAAKAAMDEFKKIENALVGSDPPWILPPLNSKIRL